MLAETCKAGRIRDHMSLPVKPPHHRRAAEEHKPWGEVGAEDEARGATHPVLLKMLTGARDVQHQATRKTWQGQRGLARER